MTKYVIRVAFLLLMVMGASYGFAQKVKLEGRVTDDSGNPLAGATVGEKGSQNKVLTTSDGTFTISVSGDAQVQISYVGYLSQTLSMATIRTAKTIQLTPSEGKLDEVVVTSLGIAKQKKSLGYASTTIQAHELVTTAPTNFASALYGKVPGVRIAAAPGGSTSGVALQLRGINSITGRTQPLIVLDGVPIHDGSFDNGNYWGDQRLRGNGLIDLNPEDIASITVLKGASAAALYGSEATNGVLVITTKSGKGKKGFTVDANLTYFQDRVAYLPQFQKVRGAGFNPGYGVYGSDENGFAHYTLNGTDYRTMISGSLNFGPVYDGQPILCWDGKVRPYSYQKNGFADLFQHGNNTAENVAFSSVSDNSNTRFSVTHQHYEGISLGSRNDKVIMSLNTTYKFGSKFRANFILNDIWQKVHNRPYADDRLINNFTGMMPAFDDGKWYQDKYKTSLGYRFVTGSNPSFTPDENLKIPNYRSDILDYMWRVKEYNEVENNNRLIANLTTFYDITPSLTLRGRIATDYTAGRTEESHATEIPLVYGYSGSYGINTNEYSILYGDLLLTYAHKFTPDLEMKVMGGYTGTREAGYTTNVSTDGGLTTENRFDLTSSANSKYNSGSSRTFTVKDAFLGTINASYKGYLFVEGTMRRDRTSTMHFERNSYVYPSANAAFVLSEAAKLPAFISYAKIRASWGIVGNYPAPYQANVAYSLGNLGDQGNGSVLTSTVSTGSYGNDHIRPEKKHEVEFGLNASFAQNRVNFDLSYYSAKIVDMILPLSLAQSTGASNILTNIGSLRNRGIEVALSGIAVNGKDYSWETGVNFSFNNNEILSLTTGSNELIHADYDGNAAVLKSVVGRPIGDFYAHPIATNDKGEPIVNDYGDGTLDYKIDADKMVRYGNAQVRAVGGFFNTFHYKDFSLEVYTDFRIGGYVMPTGLFWMTSRGLTKESLNGMDAAHGGLSYYLNAQGYGVQTDQATGPGGETVYHDGMLLKGVLPDGTENTHIESQAIYYWYVYNWGGPQYSNSEYFKYIVKNTYWKMREITLSYNLPVSFARKLKANRLQVSVFGRNLFYLYRSIKDMDAEQLTAGLQWNSSLSNAGSNPTTRSFGASIRASF